MTEIRSDTVHEQDKERTAKRVLHPGPFHLHSRALYRPIVPALLLCSLVQRYSAVIRMATENGTGQTTPGLTQQRLQNTQDNPLNGINNVSTLSCHR